MDFGQHSAEEPLLPGGGGFVRYDQTVTEVLAPIEEALKTFKLSRNAGTKAAFFKALSGQLTRLAEPGVTDVYDHLAKVFMFLRENSDSIGIVAHTRYLDVPERDRQKIAHLLVSIIANREADLTKAALDLPSGSGDGSAGESKDDPSGSENTHDRLSQIKDTLLPAVDLRILVSSLKILLDINPPECDKKRNFYTARRIELRLEVVMFKLKEVEVVDDAKEKAGWLSQCSADTRRIMDEWRQHYRNKHEVYPGKMTHDDPGSPLGELEQRLDGWLGTPAGVYDCSGRDEPSKRGNPRLIQKISLARKEVLRDGDIELTPLETTATMAGVCCTVPICAVGSALTLLMGWIACSLGVGIECDGAKAGCRLMCCFACSGDGWDAGRSGCCDADSTHAPYRNCCDVMSAVCCQANKRGVTPKQDGLARAVEQLAMD